MTITIILFIISVSLAFGILSYRAWELRTGRAVASLDSCHVPEIAFRNLEKVMLYYLRKFIQFIVVGVAKIWFILSTKLKKWLSEKWPKVHKMLQRKAIDGAQKTQSFIARTIKESRYKIKRFKEKKRQDQEQ